MPPRRRNPYSRFDKAALAPLRIHPANKKAIILKITRHRQYLLRQIDDGNMRWHHNLGWRLHPDGSAPVLHNGTIVDYNRAGWVSEQQVDVLTRSIVLTDAGRKAMTAPIPKPAAPKPKQVAEPHGLVDLLTAVGKDTVHEDADGGQAVLHGNSAPQDVTVAIDTAEALGFVRLQRRIWKLTDAGRERLTGGAS